MATVTFIALVGVAVIACLAMAWALGASSNSPPFAPAIGANAITILRASLLVGLLAAAGAVAQGGSISETVGADLINGVDITPLAAIAGLLTAAVYIASGVSTGYPIPAAFAVTGAMVGVGLALGGDPATETYLRIGRFWLAVPFVSGGLAFTTAKLLRHDRVPEPVGVGILAAAVGGVLAHVQLGILPAAPGAATGSVAGWASRLVDIGGSIAGIDPVLVGVTVAFAAGSGIWQYRRTATDVDRGIRSFLLLLGAVVAFSGGGSQVGLATGPLEHLFRVRLQAPGITLLALGAGGILVGAWTGAPRLLQATAREYAQLGERRSIAALVPGFLIAQAAITLGIPISFNNVVISGVIGGGLAAGSAGVSRRKLLTTVGFWLATLVTSVGVGYGVYTLLSTILGIR